MLTNLWAVVPVKSLPHSKSRLAHILSAGQRAELIGRFLEHLLGVLDQVPQIETVLVVSCDQTALAMARQAGAQVLVEEKAYGLNTAVTQATEVAAAAGAEGTLILPADLPFIGAEDLAMMIRATNGRRPAMTICADAENKGTNALLICPPGDFTFHYGPDSFTRHLQEAEQRGMARYIVGARGLEFDLDTERDWIAYTQSLSHANV